MGAYVNPKGATKEEWLKEHGEKIDNTTPWSAIKAECLPVILVDNGPFTAAAIGYSEKEYQYFMEPSDLRPKQVFSCAKSELLEVSSELKSYLGDC